MSDPSSPKPEQPTLTPDPQSVEGVFLAALAQATTAEREAFLMEACGGDSERRRRVEALLRAYEDAGSFLEHSPINLSGAASLNLDFLAPTSDPGLIGLLGSYEVYEVLGRGGMGIVFRARDPKLNRVVAIKVLAPELAANPNARRRFLREAQAAAAISHPHVVTIHAVDEGGERREVSDASVSATPTIPYFVMECVVGQTLQQKLDKQGSLRLTEILRIGQQIASGLAAAHKQGLIHRDIKPANVLLENGVERVKISDFGLARLIDDVSITRTGEVSGTPQYMSPEQAAGDPVDHRSDLFSLGCVLYAMCTGRSPFRATSLAAAIRRVCDDVPRPIEEINPEAPTWLIEIINQLLQKNPDDRIQSAEEVASFLGDRLAGLQLPVTSQMASRRPSSRPVTTSPSVPSDRGVGKGLIFAGIAIVVVPWVIGLVRVALGDRRVGHPGEFLFISMLGLLVMLAGWLALRFLGRAPSDGLAPSNSTMSRGPRDLPTPSDSPQLTPLGFIAAIALTALGTQAMTYFLLSPLRSNLLQMHGLMARVLTSLPIAFLVAVIMLGIRSRGARPAAGTILAITSFFMTLGLTFLATAMALSETPPDPSLWRLIAALGVAGLALVAFTARRIAGHRRDASGGRSDTSGFEKSSLSSSSERIAKVGRTAVWAGIALIVLPWLPIAFGFVIGDGDPMEFGGRLVFPAAILGILTILMGCLTLLVVYATNGRLPDRGAVSRTERGPAYAVARNPWTVLGWMLVVGLIGIPIAVMILFGSYMSMTRTNDMRAQAFATRQQLADAEASRRLADQAAIAQARWLDEQRLQEWNAAATSTFRFDPTALGTVSIGMYRTDSKHRPTNDQLSPLDLLIRAGNRLVIQEVKPGEINEVQLPAGTYEIFVQGRQFGWSMEPEAAPSSPPDEAALCKVAHLQVGTSDEVTQLMYNFQDIATRTPQWINSHERNFYWNGNTYTVDRTQAQIIQKLLVAFAAGSPDVRKADLTVEFPGPGVKLFAFPNHPDPFWTPDSGRELRFIEDVFDHGRHPAWGSLIVPGKAEGTYRLAEPVLPGSGTDPGRESQEGSFEPTDDTSVDPDDATSEPADAPTSDDGPSPDGNGEPPPPPLPTEDPVDERVPSTEAQT